MQLHNPPTRQEHVVDTLHGVAIVDPYRWLEDGESAETRTWVESQNERTRQFLASLPQMAAIRARLEDLFTTGAVGTPILRGRRSFYERRDERQDQPVLVVRDGADREEKTILDP